MFVHKFCSELWTLAFILYMNCIPFLYLFHFLARQPLPMLTIPFKNLTMNSTFQIILDRKCPRGKEYFMNSFCFLAVTVRAWELYLDFGGRSEVALFLFNFSLLWITTVLVGKNNLSLLQLLRFTNWCVRTFKRCCKKHLLTNYEAVCV